MRKLILAGSGMKVSMIAALMQLLEDDTVLIVEPLEHIEPEVHPFHNLREMVATAKECIIFPVISHVSCYINKFTKRRNFDKRALLRTRLHKYI